MYKQTVYTKCINSQSSGLRLIAITQHKKISVIGSGVHRKNMWKREGVKKNFGCTSHSLASQVLTEEKTTGSSGAAVVLLGFGFGVAEFL